MRSDQLQARCLQKYLYILMNNLEGLWKFVLCFQRTKYDEENQFRNEKQNNSRLVETILKFDSRSIKKTKHFFQEMIHFSFFSPNIIRWHLKKNIFHFHIEAPLGFPERLETRLNLILYRIFWSLCSLMPLATLLSLFLCSAPLLNAVQYRAN